MPALFGGKAVADSTLAVLTKVDRIAIALCIFIPLGSYALLFAEKVRYKTCGYDAILTYSYIATACLTGLILLAEAIILLYAVLKIRAILVKNGLSKRVKVTSFILNAVLFTFQVIGIWLWYFEFAVFSVKYYNTICSDSDSKPDCNADKVQIRGNAIKWWFGSNVASFISQVALAYILC